MSLEFILALCSAFLAGAIGLVTACRSKPSVPHLSFAAGMAVLAFEGFCAGLAADSILPETVAYWENFSLWAMSLLPATWLVFSLTYGRGNYSQFLRKWKFVLWAAFLAPAILAIGFREQLVAAVVQPAGHWVLQLAESGLAVSLLVLLGAVLVMMNLEATFRAAVGTMRWRIKFMILGLGVLFAVRAYTTTQCLLFRAASPSLQAVNTGALIIASLLLVRWLFRAGHFEVTVYPSPAILHHSLTVL